MTVGYFEDNPEYARYVSSLLRGWAADRGRELDIRHFKNGLIPMDLDLFDCLIVDIEMPLANGMDLARDVRRSGSLIPIVFLSSHTEHSLEGYEVGASRFLDKAGEHFVSKLRECMDFIAGEIDATPGSVYRFKTGSGWVSLRFKDILYFEISGHDLSIHTGASVFTERTSLKELQTRLPGYFVQINRSCFVNISRVISVTNEKVMFADRTVLPVTDKYADDLVHVYARYQR